MIIITLLIFLLGFTAVCAVVSVIVKEVSSSTGKGKAKDVLVQILNEHEIDNYSYEQFGDGQIILNDKNFGRIWVLNTDGGYSGFPYNSISDVELIVNDNITYESSLSSTTGRAIVGGVVAGGLGAIIGGATGKKNGKKTIDKIELIISYYDDNHSYDLITLLESRYGEKLDEDSCESAYRQGLLWSKRITALIGR